MVALIGPHRTHDRVLRYLGHLLIWWFSTGLGCYGLAWYGAAHQVDWSQRRPRWWRAEARRGLRDCERVLARTAPADPRPHHSTARPPDPD
jgi:hypothetical protein